MYRVNRIITLSGQNRIRIVIFIRMISYKRGVKIFTMTRGTVTTSVAKVSEQITIA